MMKAPQAQANGLLDQDSARYVNDVNDGVDMLQLRT